MNRAKLLCQTAILMVCVTSTAKATTILIDLGTDAQETSTTGWNDVSGTSGGGTIPAGPIDLDDSTGNDSGIDLSFSSTGSSGIAGTGANYDGAYPSEVSGFPASANRDSFFVGSDGAAGTLTATLSMLDPNSTYDFLIYGAAGNSGDMTSWAVNGLNSGGGSISVTLNNSTEVVSVAGIVPNGLNEITLLMDHGGNTEPGRWNVLQITVNAPVPEPTTGTALSLGTMLLLSVARKRRRRAHTNRFLPSVSEQVSFSKCKKRLVP